MCAGFNGDYALLDIRKAGLRESDFRVLEVLLHGGRSNGRQRDRAQGRPELWVGKRYWSGGLQLRRVTEFARAQRLLLAGDTDLCLIAIQTGFADQSHFTRVFRRVTGVAPARWQRDRRN